MIRSHVWVPLVAVALLSGCAKLPIYADSQDPRYARIKVRNVDGPGVMSQTYDDGSLCIGAKRVVGANGETIQRQETIELRAPGGREFTLHNFYNLYPITCDIVGTFFAAPETTYQVDLEFKLGSCKMAVHRFVASDAKRGSASAIPESSFRLRQNTGTLWNDGKSCR